MKPSNMWPQLMGVMDRLQSPNLVSSFQRKFGVHIDASTKVHSPPFPSNGNQTQKSSEHYIIPHTISNYWWYYLFRFGASLGYEIFYATFFPCWFWNIDGAVGRRMVLLWVIIMYVGQALKDIIKWARPSSPPVVALEPEYALEYGMPSTHAMVGVALPFSMVIFTYTRYDYSLWIGILGAIFWALVVCGSRLYLGMHSALDIIAGILLSCLMMIVLIPLVDWMDQLHLTSIYSPLVTFPVIIAMAFFYPKSDRWSPARGDTCVIMGAGSGILIGSWINYQLGVIRGPELEPPFPIIWPGFAVIGLALGRGLIGVMCLLLSRVIGKWVGLILLCKIRGLNYKDKHVRTRPNVEVPYKLSTYLLMGVTITFLSPLLFRYLNIERQTMYTEV